MTLADTLKGYDAEMCVRCGHQRGEHEEPADIDQSCEDHGQCRECDCRAFVDPELAEEADRQAGGGGE